MNLLLHNKMAQDFGLGGGSILAAVAEVVHGWGDPKTWITLFGLTLLILRAATEYVRVKNKGSEI